MLQSDGGSGKEGQTGAQAISLNGATGLGKKSMFSQQATGQLKNSFLRRYCEYLFAAAINS